MRAAFQSGLVWQEAAAARSDSDSSILGVSSCNTSTVLAEQHSSLLPVSSYTAVGHVCWLPECQHLYSQPPCWQQCAEHCLDKAAAVAAIAVAAVVAAAAGTAAAVV
jgi:hypothetical protein